MKTVLAFVILASVLGCTKKTESLPVDAGTVTIVEPEKIEEAKTVSVEEVLPKNLDEKLDKLVEEGRKEAYCRDN